MRQGNQNNRNNRQRGRGRRQNNNTGGNPSNKVYDSNGPEVRVRGSAQTVAEKYLQLAGDAHAQGDRVKAESFFQHAEHYLRIVSANQTIKDQRQAEKDKAAEEHAARIQAKKDKAAAELEKSAAANGSKPAQEEEPAKEEEEKLDVADEDWGGHQPAFLQREDDQEVEKPKKPRRKPAKKKTAAKTEPSDSDDAASPA